MTLRSLISRLSSPSTSPSRSPDGQVSSESQRRKTPSPSPEPTSRRASPSPTYSRRGSPTPTYTRRASPTPTYTRRIASRNASNSRSASPSPSTQSQKPPATAPSCPNGKRLRIHLPLYIYPTPTSWKPLYEQLSKHPDVQFDIIINPASGPGPQSSLPDANYAAEVTKLNSFPNVRLYGYVHVSWGERPLEHVLRDVRTWQGWNAASPPPPDNADSGSDHRAHMVTGPERTVQQSVSAPGPKSVVSANPRISHRAQVSEGLSAEYGHSSDDDDEDDLKHDAVDSVVDTTSTLAPPSLSTLSVADADSFPSQPQQSPVRKPTPPSRALHTRRPSPLRQCIAAPNGTSGPHSPLSPTLPTRTVSSPQPPQLDIHISGIFVDEAPHHERHISYISTLYAFIRSHLSPARQPASPALIWLNPGCPVSAPYYAVADRITAFEASHAAWSERGLAGMEPDSVAGKGGARAQRAKTGVMVHSVPRIEGGEVRDVLRKAREEGVDGVFVTGERGYEAWGLGWAEFVAAVDELG